MSKMKNYYQLLADFIELYVSAPTAVADDLSRLFPKETDALFNSLLKTDPSEQNASNRVLAEAKNKLIENEV